MSFQELEAQWILVENEFDAKKLSEKLQRNGGNGAEGLPLSSSDCEESFRNALLLKCLIRTGEIGTSYDLQSKFDALFPDKNDQSLHIFHHLLALFHLFVDKHLENARANIRKAIAFAETDIEDTLISAQILIAKGQRQLANTQLVNAAKEAPNDWRVFYWLSENLLAIGMLEKAKICVEHARKTNAKSELCAKLLDEILVKTNSADSVRFNALQQFLSNRPTSLWALRQTAILEINAGRFDSAIDKCQRSIRLMANTFGERPENIEHRQQICAIWAFLSEAYRQKGNLQSAVRACRAIIELDEANHTAKLQLIQLHQSMGHFRDAIALGEQFEDGLSECDQSNALPAHLFAHFRTIHLQSLVLFVSDSEEMRRSNFVKTQLETLPHIFARAKVLLNEGENAASVLLHRCLAQAFKIVQGFNQLTLRKFLFSSTLSRPLADGGWAICSRSELAKARIRSLVAVLRANRRASDTWNELGKAFLDTFLLNIGKKSKPNTFLESALHCFQAAVRFSSSNLKKSEYLCNLARLYLLEGNASRAQHCLVRAIQLNRHCAIAWALLSFLYLQLGLNDEALEAMNNAQMINPSMSETWLPHAIHAELSNHYDTMDLYRHAIVLKPSAFAVQKYCHFLLDHQRRRNALAEGSMINFEVLKSLFFNCPLSAQFVHALASLAEHFWHLEEAVEFFCEPKNLENVLKEDKIMARNKERILIKSGRCSSTADQLEHEFPGSGLGKLKTLYDEPTPALFDRIQQLSPFRELVTSLRSSDLTSFSHFYKPSLFPLLASASLIFALPFPSAVFSAIESVRPLHRLFDVFSMVYAGYQSDRPLLAPHDEDEVIVRHEHLTESLFTLLKQKMEEEQQQTEKGKETSDQRSRETNDQI
ncbi:hypothetical protein niasHT_007915 [Heterodera trifolii]|uniref:TPR_REGION domain-containing protein n=1 Tax=Heterodera trifolii TaxID=157864 RepID=A0ABD2LZD6_9BILA